MKAKNQKGFVLVETLIVSVFVMALFTMLYTNVIPLIGQYEKRENYDDIDSKYTAHWVRKMVLDYGTDYLKNSVQLTNPNYNGYLDITGCKELTFTDTNYCNTLKDKFNISKMYVTTYDLTKVKQNIINENISNEFKNYIDYLPNYSSVDGKKGYHRIIVEIDHDSYKTYGTIEVMR